MIAHALALAAPRPRLRAAARCLAALLSLVAPSAARAQVPTQPPTQPARPDARAAGDTTPRASADTGAGQGGTRELVKFPEPDSAMAALLQRRGYTPVRYKGDTVRFNAQTRELTLEGRPSGVQRDEAIIVGKSIRYNDSTQIVTAVGDPARGDTVWLRDPSQGGEDVVSRGGLTYDIATRRGTLTAFSTAVTEGETWLISGRRGAIVSDTVINGQRVYVQGGTVTSCQETVPHYHFEAKEIKVISKKLLVVRPAVLYVGDVPVMWLPFIFQDMRSGRRSGILSPRFGIAELVRNSANYRRSIENLGYYFNLGDYADTQAWIDWRSGGGGEVGDPGWLRFNGEVRYRWLDRFMQGRLSASYLAQRDGSRNTSLSLQHEQSFNQNRRVSTNVNWVQSTTVQRQNQIDPNSVLGTINSQLNFQDKFGPASFSAGGSAKQYPGRAQKDIDFPNLNLSSQTVAVAEWLDWTPSVAFTNNQSFNIDQGTQFSYVFRGPRDSVSAKPSRRSTSFNVESPLKIGFERFDYQLQLGFRFSEDVQDYPQTRVIYRDVNDTTTKETRVFNQTYLSSIDIPNPTIGLPRLFQGSWNITPQVSLSNVDQGGFFVRTERTGGKWVNQRKRFAYGASASPTFYAFPPGFGPVARFRHSINPVLTYSYSPEARVSDEYLAAIGRTAVGYLGSLSQNRVSLSLTSNLEAKLRGRAAATTGGAAAGPAGPGTPASPADTAAAPGAAPAAPRAEGSVVRLLSLNFTPLSYDFKRADSIGGGWFNQRGFTDAQFGYSARSDVVPGLDFRSNYSLFLGDPQSDTAQFKPILTDVGVTFSLDQSSPLFAAVGRLFGRRQTPGAQTTTSVQTEGAGRGALRGGDEFFARQAQAQQVAGSGARNARFDQPMSQGWQMSVTYTSARQRPDIRGPTVDLDPTVGCRALQQTGSQFAYEQCVLNARTNPPSGQQQFGQSTLGGAVFRSPPTRNLQLNTSFHITPKWSTQWTTTYDFVRGDFGSNVLNFQRELHDWRAVFAVTQSPNGNFAFNFFIALKAQPDIKFDYNRQTYRGPGAGGGFDPQQ